MSIDIVRQAMELQTKTVDLWHRESIEIRQNVAAFMSKCPISCQSGVPADSLVADSLWLETICRQHSFNFLLWHQEDIARSPVVSDAEMARVKRAIDGYNQQRNDWIEKVDDYLNDLLDQRGIQPLPEARLNTETPGSAFDRLSIMSLRLYHLEEQLERPEIDQEHHQKVSAKIQICRIQQHDLGQSLAQLLQDILAGVKRHRTYRQCKMYNDPTLNPEVYKAKRAA